MCWTVFALLYLCRSMLKECRIKRTWVYYLFVLPIAAVIFVYNHYFPTVWGLVIDYAILLVTVLTLFRDKIRYRILWYCVAQVIPFAMGPYGEQGDSGKHPSPFCL